MKYAIGNRVNFVQIETQFSNEMKLFLSEYAGNNQSKFHKTVSVITQIIMLAGNTGGYFLPATDDDNYINANNFNVHKNELEAIYDVATRRGVFDREQYIKNHIITNQTLQISYINAKYRNKSFNMEGNFILVSTYNFFKSDDKYSKIVSSLDKFASKNSSIEQDGKVQNGIELNGTEEVTFSPDDMTLDDFKIKYPEKCVGLPNDWQPPKGVSLNVIAEAIEKSQKFLKVKPYMTLEKLATEYYDKVRYGMYEDSSYNKTPTNKKETLSESLKNIQNIVEVLPDE